MAETFSNICGEKIFFSLRRCYHWPPKGDCLLYTSDAADEEDSVDLGGRRIIKKNAGE